MGDGWVEEEGGGWKVRRCYEEWRTGGGGEGGWGERGWEEGREEIGKGKQRTNCDMDFHRVEYRHNYIEFQRGCWPFPQCNRVAFLCKPHNVMQDVHVQSWQNVMSTLDRVIVRFWQAAMKLDTCEADGSLGGKSAKRG